MSKSGNLPKPGRLRRQESLERMEKESKLNANATEFVPAGAPSEPSSSSSPSKVVPSSSSGRKRKGGGDGGGKGGGRRNQGGKKGGGKDGQGHGRGKKEKTGGRGGKNGGKDGGKAGHSPAKATEQKTGDNSPQTLLSVDEAAGRPRDASGFETKQPIEFDTALRNKMNFFPKFDNLGRAHVADVLDSLETDDDVLLFTKKHSGSLVLVSAKYRDGRACIVVNSKNSTDNEFSRTAEHYLRAQFKAVFGSEAQDHLGLFADFCWSNNITFCFEWVTAVLGDHAETPLLPYMVLTVVSQTNQQGETRFASLPEVVQLAVRFRLIVNEMWAVTKDRARAVATGVQALRWTGYDKEFTAYLNEHCTYKVSSMLPHCMGQGQRLEGLVVQAYRTKKDLLMNLQKESESIAHLNESLVPALKAFQATLDQWKTNHNLLPSFHPPDKTNKISSEEMYTFVKDLATRKGPTGKMFAHLLEKYPAEGGRLNKLLSMRQVWFGKTRSLILHLHRDDVFFAYAKSMPSGASQLFRGFEVQFEGMVCPTPSYQPPNHPWKLLGISKWKNWRYLFHTFCLRNALPQLFRSGLPAYMTQVKRQFSIWGLPAEHIPEHLKFAKTWGNWLLAKGAAKQFLNERRSFSYLSFLEHDFYPSYRAGLLAAVEDKNLPLFVVHFSQQPPPHAKHLCAGYTIKNVPNSVVQGDKNQRKRKRKTVRKEYHEPGAAYVVNGIEEAKKCPVPHAIVLIGDGTGQNYATAKSQLCGYPYPVLEAPTPASYKDVVEHLAELDKAAMPKRRFMLCMLGMQPGCGKSSYSEHACQVLNSMGIKAVLICSDNFGVGKDAKVPFEDAVVKALRSDADVIIYDKNIPNMEGYDCAVRVMERAVMRNTVMVPICPSSFTEEDARLCVARVMARAPGSHTLTAESKIEKFASPEAFIEEIFTQPCLAFVPVAQLLPGVITLTGFFQEGQQTALAQRTAEILRDWDQQAGGTGLNLTQARFLGLCFELEPADREYVENALGLPVRDLLHATMVYYGRDAALMAKAAMILGSHGPNKTVSLQMTRLGKVQSPDGNMTLAWGSLDIPGFEGTDSHATLIANGFKPFGSRAGEHALCAGEKVVALEKAEYPIDSVVLPAPLKFEASWSLMS